MALMGFSVVVVCSLLNLIVEGVRATVNFLDFFFLSGADVDGGF